MRTQAHTHCLGHTLGFRQNLEHDSIASVRVEEEAEDGGPGGAAAFRTLSGDEIRAQQGHCLVRVPTVEPALHPRWFLEQIAKARERHAAEKHYL